MTDDNGTGQGANGRLRLRVVFEPGVVLGPGKADLLEGIRASGSISAAGRRMRMSYKRAWDLVVALNRYFDTPVVQTSKGGSGGGGASLTPFGEQLLAAYRRIEAKSAQAAADEMAWLRDHLASGDAEGDGKGDAEADAAPAALDRRRPGPTGG